MAQGFAPSQEEMLEILPGRTINNTTFTSSSRFVWSGESGNWFYILLSANVGRITQVYDEDIVNSTGYREETELTFTSETSGTYRYREFTGGFIELEQTGEFDFPWLAGLSAKWYDSAADLGSGWRWFDWFGAFNVSTDPWIYHAEHGWLYPFADDPSNVYFWDGEMESIVWTSESAYPSIYRFSDAKWLFYQKGSSNPRWFVNLLTGQWEQW